MHHLHPRSRTTSTLFTTTLAVSFLVVSLPHLLPCPVDRRQFADSIEGPDGKVRRRRRRKDVEGSSAESGNTQALGQDSIGEGIRSRDRECPVPKPGGLIGQMMGFEQKQQGKPVEVVVKGLRTTDDKDGTP